MGGTRVLIPVGGKGHFNSIILISLCATIGEIAQSLPRGGILGVRKERSRLSPPPIDLNLFKTFLWRAPLALQEKLVK